MQSNFYKGVFYVFIGAICFATKGIFAKLAFRYNVGGLQILTLRMLFSLPFYVFILAREYRKKQSPIAKPIWTNIILLGLIGYYLAALFDFRIAICQRKFGKKHHFYVPYFCADYV